MFPELFGNGFQRKDQVLGKVERAIGVVREGQMPGIGL